MFDHPMLKSKDKHVNSDILNSADASVELEYPCHSKISMPSMDYHRNGACILVVAIKCTYDEGLLLVINA